MLIIIDGNNVAWAAFHALGRAMGAETPAQKVRATLLGLTQSVLGLVTRGAAGGAATLPGFLDRDAPVSGLAVAFDEGRPLRRRAAFPAYQTGREAQPSFIDNEPYVLEAIAQFIEGAQALPLRILRGKNTEADDLIAALTLQRPPVAVRIASTDRDFLQLIDDRVSVFSFVKKVVLGPANFAEQALPRDKSGEPIVFPRERFLDYRALTGDSSDDLPGVPGIGALTAARLLASAPLEAYLDNPSRAGEALERGGARVTAALESEEGKAIIARNRELMDLRVAAERYPDLRPYTIHGMWDEPGVRGWLRDLRPGRLDIDGTLAAMAGIAARGPNSMSNESRP